MNEAIKALDEKFTSGKSIDVERSTITRDEYLELRRLHEVNQELVEKLKWAYRYALDHADQEYPFDWAIYCEALHQAIANAKGESNE